MTSPSRRTVEFWGLAKGDLTPLPKGSPPVDSKCVLIHVQQKGKPFCAPALKMFDGHPVWNKNEQGEVEAIEEVRKVGDDGLVREIKYWLVYLEVNREEAVEDRASDRAHIGDYRALCKGLDGILHDRRFKRIPTRYRDEARRVLVAAAVRYAQDNKPLILAYGGKSRRGRHGMVGLLMACLAETFTRKTGRRQYALVENLMESFFPELSYKGTAQQILTKFYKRNPQYSRS